MKNLIKVSLFLFALVAIFFVSGFTNFNHSNIALADTNIPGGVISVDTVWTKADSPYIITDNILVNKDVTLKIEPGTVVKLDGIYIDVLGNLDIAGTASERVTFSSLAPGEYFWGKMLMVLFLEW